MSSSISKGIKKSFKSLVKHPLKAIPVAIGLAATVFTAGAAIGALPTWGSAIGSVTQSLGLSGNFANVLTGALTQAGYGAALGTLGGIVTGSDFGTGATIGGAAGLVSGGIMGGMGLQTDPLSGLNKTGAPATGISTSTSTTIPGSSSIVSSPLAAQAPGAAAAGSAAQAIGGGGGGGMLDSTTEALLGGAVSGIGQGIFGGQQASDEAKALAARDNATRKWIASNYNTSGGGMLDPQQVASLEAESSKQPTPDQRFSNDFYSGAFDFQWDPAQGKVVKTPAAASA